MGFGMNEKGGMDTEAFSKYLLEFVVFLYPDAADVPDKRVLITLDPGPGSLNHERQAWLREMGFYTFPGLPNGTEVGRELDQLFA